MKILKLGNCINMGNTTVSGVIDKGAGEKVSEMIDDKIDVIVDAVMPLVPAL